MFKEDQMDKANKMHSHWDARCKKSFSKFPPRKERCTTVSDLPIKSIYTPEDIKEMDFAEDIGYPGFYPYTRGVQPTMYKGRLWTMRMFAGFGSAKDTNERFKYLVQQGQTGLSTAFDMPTLMGYDTGSTRAKGECGKCGVAIDTLADMEQLFDGLPVDKITTSMTINPPAAIIWAMYIAAAEKRGIPRAKLGGTIQNDMLKEFIAQKTFMCPPEESVRVVVDTIEFGAKEVPKWNTVSISGYHIREAGATAAQELAFTLYDGITYVEESIKRGLDVDAFAPRLSFFFNAHIDFFEEIAKYRAARRMWARFMKERFKATDPRSMLLRFHTQTAGCSLTAQQPYNNVVRTTTEALSAVLGGTQSLHTNSLDEVLALPTEHSVTIALRTQQILAEEIGVTNTIDPLGGSYFVEALTNKIEEEAMAYIDKMDDMGGMLAAIDNNYPQKEIADSAYRFQNQYDSGEQIMVGANKYETEDKVAVPLLEINQELENQQIEKLGRIKENRDNKLVDSSIDRLKEACAKDQNVMPYLLDCANTYCTLQEMCDAFRDVFGIYRDPGIF